jgi:glycine/D-amino acid oxidase-like deaminating enzyme
MTLPTSNNTTTTRTGLDDALLCGKYVSPLPPSIEDVTTTSSNTRRYVIGATHEYQSIPLSANEVQEELKSRTYQMAKQLWDIGSIDKITCGVRVQSSRGKYGCMPIVGRINTTTISSTTSSSSSASNTTATTTTTGISHHNTWIFTGLSSRGLIYHGLFGSWLATAILHNDETNIRDKFPEFDWWREQ